MSGIAPEFEDRLGDPLDADRRHPSRGALARIDKIVAVPLGLTGVAAAVWAGSRGWAYSAIFAVLT